MLAKEKKKNGEKERNALFSFFQLIYDLGDIGIVVWTKRFPIHKNVLSRFIKD